MKKNVKLIGLWLLLVAILAQCTNDKQNPLSNIDFYNKDVAVVKKYIQGEWILAYTYGGFAARKNIPTNNYYLKINGDKLTMGSDQNGVFADCTIQWSKTNVDPNTFFYIMTFKNKYNYSESMMVYKISNDTLITQDYNISDGYSYYYLRK